MDREPGARRRAQIIDWLEMNPDLPHLFARLSELVHVAGYAPEDLVVVSRAEIDRRETAAFTAGWAEAMSEELPRIRREYEKRVADAYAQGQRDARGIRRPQRRTEGGEDGARVIPLPFARFLEPPVAVLQAEERIRSERELLERRPEPDPDPAVEPRPDPDLELQHATAPPDDEHSRPRADESALAPDVLPTAQDVRARRAPQPVRKVVRGKGGRPIVPPLGVPVQPGSGGDRRSAGAGEPDSRAQGRRLSERARALEEELVDRAQEAPPETDP
ncbi:hypothetical protein [Streptomyces vilmorinianum]|uniref:hypothetical protein n=1 Tax=Streptomyces vilmorinianum TaxID=3051092 RepID=UPI0010FB80B9|nr:hypothetical protein [Streptomyces vilmorinianum]